MNRYGIKAPILILILAISAITSCKKEKPYQYKNTAQIIGYDLRDCPCCGGYQVTIDNVPNPNGNSFFLAGEFPSNFSLGTNPAFPVAVKMDWEVLTTTCFGNYIKISKIEKQ
ncbi:hypothetical protein [Flavihumibacter profundi]|jgi:hypothetical protein|uniref:hypothetical protein n=1 Tax=Flavihumibacter profundi TaxID=2716883 RepID=UPI001CC77936|nr:hypothetical protein [Flavihumibacter profundi]MBZ5856818.1 hypothetical protein [Flavihumibacter profundi]